MIGKLGVMPSNIKRLSFVHWNGINRTNKKNNNKHSLYSTSEYPATIVLDSACNIFLKNETCAGINQLKWQGIL